MMLGEERPINVCQCSKRGSRGMSALDCICPSSARRITLHGPQPFVPPLMACGYPRCPPSLSCPCFQWHSILRERKKKKGTCTQSPHYWKWAKSTLQIHLHLGGICIKALFSTKLGFRHFCPPSTEDHSPLYRQCTSSCPWKYLFAQLPRAELSKNVHRSEALRASWELNVRETLK